MDPYTYPSDELLNKWANRYGSTGLKIYDLDLHAANEGCVAVYRESSMAERVTLARFAEIEKEHPGSYETMRMFVSNLLLYPNIDDYPEPTFAIAELFNIMRQHGHGPLSNDEEFVGQEVVDDEIVIPGLPSSMVKDIKTARSTMSLVFKDPRYGSIYKNLVVELAAGPEGIDIQTLDYLWHLPLGKLRDLAALAEQANLEIRQILFPQIAKIKNKEQQKFQAQRLEQLYNTPFSSVDEQSNGLTIPEDMRVEDEENTSEDSESDNNSNRPKITKQQLIAALEEGFSI